MNIMNIINNINYNKKYTELLVDNNWTQKTKEKSRKLKENYKQYKKIDDFLYNEYNFLSILNIDSMDSVFMNIASNIDENTKECYDKFNYGRNFSKKIIQRGLQEKNNLSTLLYLGDLYNISFIINNIYNKKMILLNDNNNKKEIINYNNNVFSINTEDIKDIDKIKYDYENINDLKKILNCNINSLEIYKNNLKAISNYKLNELIKLADENKICIKDDNNKNKTKKQLYYEINKSLRNN